MCSMGMAMQCGPMHGNLKVTHKNSKISQQSEESLKADELNVPPVQAGVSCRVLTSVSPDDVCLNFLLCLYSACAWEYLPGMCCGCSLPVAQPCLKLLSLRMN